MYEPDINDASDLQSLKEYVDQELRKISGALLIGETDSLDIRQWTSLPPRPYDRVIAFLDNSISGIAVSGIHVYHDGTWQLLVPLRTDTEWRDNDGTLSNAKSVGSTVPTYRPLNGSKYLVPDMISGGGTKILQIAFHINHDVKQGSVIYPHVHWSTDGNNAGTVTWQLDYQYAAGHDQANFPASTTILLPHTVAPAAAWRHFIAEGTNPVTQGIPMPEVDSILCMTVEVQANTIPTDLIYGVFVDLHYEVERYGTKNKAPNFYT